MASAGSAVEIIAAIRKHLLHIGGGYLHIAVIGNGHKPSQQLNVGLPLDPPSEDPLRISNAINIYSIDVT